MTSLIPCTKDAEQASALIDALGGTGQVAALCSVRAPSISQWRKRGIPRPWALFFQAKFPEKFDPTGRVIAADEAHGAS